MKSMILAAVALLAVASFCAAQPGSQNEINTNANEPASNASMTGNTGGAMSDATLAALIKTINDTEVQAGKLAEKRAKAKNVKQFARMMVRDHGTNNNELAQVSKRIGLQPSADEQVTAMKDQAKQDSQALEGETGADFDRAYVDQMVKGHEDALKKLDDAVANNAGRNEQLDAFLKKTRQKISMHLDQARKLQSESSGGMRSREQGTDTNRDINRDTNRDTNRGY